MAVGKAPSGQFKERRDVWLACLSGDDCNSILRQIHGMIWDVAAFKVINEARRFAPMAKDGGYELNSMMHELIDVGFFTRQAASVRRLTDKSSLNGDRGVYSLVSLLEDMRKWRQLFTRESMFSAEGLEYDVDLLQKKQKAYLAAELKAGKRVTFIPREIVPDPSVRRHGEIDWLTGTDMQSRKKTDTLRLEMLDGLLKRLENSSKSVKLHVDKFVAHVVCSPKLVPSGMRVLNRPKGPEGTRHEGPEAHPGADHRQAA